MNLRIILSTLALIVCVAAEAQSLAAQIKEIQKNRVTYINAESTGPSEDVAYESALRQIIDMARNFVDTNNNGASISDAAIKSVVKKIVYLRQGDFKRVFLYAKRDDLLGKSGDNESEESSQIAENQKTENTKAKVEEEEESFQPVQSYSEQQQEISSDFNEIEDYEEFEKNLPQDIVSDVLKSADIPVATKELIDSLQACNSLSEVLPVLDKYKNRRIISNYGSSKQASNTIASYWVVEDNGSITVLGPEIRGHRNNFRTGKVDALHRYQKGIWFRKR